MDILLQFDIFYLRIGQQTSDMLCGAMHFNDPELAVFFVNRNRGQLVVVYLIVELYDITLDLCRIFNISEVVFGFLI